MGARSKDYPVGLIRANGTPKPAYYALLNFFKSRIYQGEIQLSDGTGSIETLEGWYYVTISDKDDNVIGSYRIHVDGGSETRIVFHLYENETIKAEVEKLRQQLEGMQKEIVSLEKEVQRLKEDLQDKEALIAELRRKVSENVTATTLTVTTTAMATKTVVSQPKQPLIPDILIVAVGSAMLVAVVVTAILIWKYRRR